MQFIFDLETTGLPKFNKDQTSKKRSREYPASDNLTAYDSARVVSAAWILIDTTTKEIINEEYYIITPDNFQIPQESINIHGITEEIAITQGISIANMFEHLQAALKQSTMILSYNLEFDYHILLSELFRYEKKELIDELTSKRQDCIMLMSQKYMQSPFFPKLTDVHRYLFNAPAPNAHNALADVMSCYKVYKEIYKKIS